MNIWMIYGIITLVIILVISWYLFKKILHIALILLIAFAILFTYNNYFSPEVCEIENCHGLEIQCGSEPVQACTAMYSMGDKCRQYSGCEISLGQCKPIKSDEFELCKACVEGCISNYNDPLALSECESQC